MEFLNKLSRNELQWFPEVGFGYFPVTATPYDERYFDNYRRWDWTAIGDALNEARVSLVSRHTTTMHDALLCDVGIGGGRFVADAGKKLRNLRVRGFDVNPSAVSWLSSHGLLKDPNADMVDVATFWDSLEHILDPAPLLKNVRKLAIVSLPIFTDAAHVLRSKHFKKEEHCLYFTRGGLIRFMDEQGFSLLEVNTMEQEAGREDIESFAFERVRDV